MLKTKNWVIWICCWPFALFAQVGNPLEKVKFYDLDELSVEELIATAGQSRWYNKTYNSQRFLTYYFLPWKMKTDEKAIEIRQSTDFQKFFDAEERLKKSDCYGGNYNPLPESFTAALIRNTAAAGFPNWNAWAAVTQETSLRRMPTEEFCFQDIRNAGEGYPFDYFQETSLWIGTPLLILHRSVDQRWFFVVSPYSHGWIQARHIAMVSPAQGKQLMKRPFAAVLKEGAIVQTKGGPQKLEVGTILPMSGASDGASLTIKLPFRKSNGKLGYYSVAADRSMISAFPIAFTPANISRQLGQLLGEKYGWGGLDGGRDCSSTIKDLLTPFGIWLPRNSVDQRLTGEVIEINGSPTEKLAAIREKGVPFLTIIYKKGHSMLYVGQDKNGIPLIFHNVWGLKPILVNEKLKEIADQREQLGVFGVHRKDQDGEGVFARYIIGKAVITAVDPERAFKDTKFDSFIENIISMNFIVK